MIGGNNFISIQIRNQWTGRFRTSIFFQTTKNIKLETKKGGLITLDEDLKVNSQKADPKKKQFWTVDPQESF